MSKRKAKCEGALDSWITSEKRKFNCDDEKLELREAPVDDNMWKNLHNGLLVYSRGKIVGKLKIAGFDLDGTIITTRSGKIFPTDEKDWKLNYHNVPIKLKELDENGYRIVFFTNQKGLQARKADIENFQKKIVSICDEFTPAIQVFVSLGSLKFRKPYIGMWEQMEKFDNSDVRIDRSASFFVGDAAGRIQTKDRKRKDHSCADRLFALNLGICFKTPEQFFLSQTYEEPYILPAFNPSLILDEERLLFDKEDTIVPNPEKELIVLVGFPGCGKTHFAQSMSSKHNYSVVNRDSLKTLQKCVENARVMLMQGKSVIVDNTNRDAKSRKPFCDLAKQCSVHCRSFVFNCHINQARHNCKYRIITGTDLLHEDISIMVLRMFKSAYQEPTLQEGFSSIVHVNFVPQFIKPELVKIYRMYLCDN